MVSQALGQDHEIVCSSRQYGRALLHSDDAGDALITLMEADRCLRDTHSLPDNLSSGLFHRHLIPGLFVPFVEWAQLVIDECRLAKVRNADSIRVVEKEAPTPDFLRAHCRSDALVRLGWRVDREDVKERVYQGLRHSVRVRLSQITSATETGSL